MNDKFKEIKEKILLSQYLTGTFKIQGNGKRLRYDNCPYCKGEGCADIIQKYNNEYFDCKQCGVKGTIIDIYGHDKGINPKTKEGKSQIVNELCKAYGVDNNTNNQEVKSKGSNELLQVQKSDTRVTKQYEDTRKQYNFTNLVELLHKQLLENPEGMKYFLDRGLSEDTIKRFKLGYEPKGINEAFKDYPEIHLYKDLAECYPYFIPMFKDGVCEYILPRQDKNILDKKLQDGILHKTDKEGNERSYPKTMNLKNVPTTLYNFNQAMKDDYIFITEGWCDALSIETLGFSAIALNSVTGVNSFIRKIQDIKDYQSKYYIVALDKDTSGAKARAELEQKLIDLKCKVKHLYPEGEGVKDVNDMLLVGADVLNDAICNIFLNIEQEKQELLVKNSCFNYLEDTLKKFINNKDKKLLSTGYKKLDATLGGGLYNSLYVIGGISGLGKTSIVLNVLENLAKENNDVMFISLEMSREELIAKSLSRFTRETVDKRFTPVDYPSQRDIQNGNFDIEAPYFKAGLKNYSEASKNIFIQEANFNYNTEKIREDIINHKMLRGKAPILVVDYLQVLPCLKDYGDDKKNIDFNITELKRISREYDIPVIVISSIGRQYYKKQIDFEAFKSSGNIEFTADVVIGLQYSFMADIGNKSDNEIVEKYKEAKSQYPREVQTVILKNRNGSIGEYTDFIYEPKYNYFKEV
jgi:replicative DNA helicase